jgi:hypothetical protein
MMDRLTQLWRRLLFYVRRDRFDRELEEEMRHHMAMRAEENLGEGMSAEEARARSAQPAIWHQNTAPGV